MSYAQPLTILDVAYDVLSRSPEALSAEQIAAAARGEGYDLGGGEVKAEIDSHLRQVGHRSPFTEVGRTCYTLLPLPAQVQSLQDPLSILKPVAATAALLVILFLAFWPSNWTGRRQKQPPVGPPRPNLPSPQRSWRPAGGGQRPEPDQPPNSAGRPAVPEKSL
jgi:hypothetical protein